MIDFIATYFREILLGTCSIVGVFYAFKYGSKKNYEREDFTH